MTSQRWSSQNHCGNSGNSAASPADPSPVSGKNWCHVWPSRNWRRQIRVSVSRARSGTACIVPSVSWAESRVPMPRPSPVSYAEAKRDQWSVVRHWIWFQTLTIAFSSGSGVSTTKRER